jgi:hypothetical protein
MYYNSKKIVCSGLLFSTFFLFVGVYKMLTFHGLLTISVVRNDFDATVKQEFEKELLSSR